MLILFSAPTTLFQFVLPRISILSQYCTSVFIPLAHSFPHVIGLFVIKSAYGAMPEFVIVRAGRPNRD